jgi:WD40 repeat protein
MLRRRLWHALPLVLALASPARAAVELIREWKAAPVLLQSVEFSPDGASVLTASGGGVAQLWTLDGRAGPVFKGQRPPMFKAHFSPDGSELLTTGYDGTVWIWTPQGKPLKRLSVHRAATAEARFYGNPTQEAFDLVTSSDDGQVVIRDLDGTPRWSAQYSGTARQFAINRDGSLIVASSDNGQLHFIRPHASRTSADVNSVQTPHGRINRIAFSPDQSLIAVAAIDGRVSLWSPSGDRVTLLSASAHGWSRGAAFCSIPGSPLLTIGDDGVVREWTPSGTLKDSITLTSDSSLTSIDCSPDGRRAVVVGSNGQLWLLSVTSPR